MRAHRVVAHGIPLVRYSRSTLRLLAANQVRPKHFSTDTTTRVVQVHLRPCHGGAC